MLHHRRMLRGNKRAASGISSMQWTRRRPLVLNNLHNPVLKGVSEQKFPGAAAWLQSKKTRVS
jgi:hypothetical protein